MTIGKLSVLMTGNIGGFEAALKKGSKVAQGWADDMAIAGKLAGGALLTAGAAAGVAAGAALAGLTALTIRSLEQIDATAKLSDRLGINTEALIGLQHAAGLAGVDADGLTGALEKMLNNLAEAATKGGPAADALARMGLSARDLANLQPDAAFRAIADGLKGIENPALRAAAAQDIFGKAGQSLLPLMLSGAKGIAAAQAEAERLGITLSRVDAAKVEMANDAMSKLTDLATGVGNRIAVQVSPFITDASDRFIAWMTEGDKLATAITWTIGKIGSAAGWVADQIELPKLAFYGFRAGALEAIASVLGGIDWLGEGLVKLLNLVPGVNLAWTDSFKGMAEAIRGEAAKEVEKFNASLERWKTGAGSKELAAYIDGVTKSAQQAGEAAAAAGKNVGRLLDPPEQNKKIQEMLDEAQKQLRQFGLTDIQKQLQDFGALGATPEQTAALDQMLKRLEEMKRLKEEAEASDKRAAAIIEDNLTTQEKTAKALAEIDALYAAGKLTEEQYSRAFAKISADGSGGMAQAPQAPASVEANSAAGRSFLANLDGRRRNDPMREQLAVAKQAKDRLDQIAKNTAKPSITVVSLN